MQRPIARRARKGISAFIVEKGLRRLQGRAEARARWAFAAARPASWCSRTAACRRQNLLGEEDRGVKVVMSGLDLERTMVAPLCLGIAERALEISIEYARTRQQFGQPIGNFQLIRGKLAEMYVWVESMRLFTYRRCAPRTTSRSAAAAAARSTRSARPR
jgi:isovaleryl-CoA dehydrogenase